MKAVIQGNGFTHIKMCFSHMPVCELSVNGVVIIRREDSYALQSDLFFARWKNNIGFRW